MTQQPYAPQPQYGQPQAYPQQPQQGYPAPQPYSPQQPQPGQYVPNGPGYQTYPAQPQAYPQPAYGQQPAVPQGPPPVQGTLDAFNQQPSGGSGPGLSFKNAPLGTAFSGTVTRDVRDSDVIQDTDYNTKAPLFFRDGRPRLVLGVPFQLDAPDAQHQDGAATLHVRTGVKSAMEDAMAQLGISGPPKSGDHIVLTLVERKNTGQGNPKSIYHVFYSRDGQSSSPAPQIDSQGYGYPPQAQQAPAWAQPPVPQAPQLAQSVQQQPQGPQPGGDPWAVQQAQQPPAAEQATAPQAVPGLPPGITMTAEQQAFLATLQNGQGQ